MTVSTRSPAEGGTTGFRRLGSYPHAIPANDARVILDPQEPDLPRRAAVRAGLTNIQASALADIEGISEAMPWREPARLVPYCSPDLAFALALDQPRSSRRLPAIVARAFARADAMAAVCAEELELRADAAGLSAAVTRLLEHLDSAPIRRAVAMVDHARWEPEGVAAARREDIRLCVAAFEMVGRTLDHVAGEGLAFGWPLRDEARFFLVLRLAELIAIGTGHVPTFHALQRKSEEPWTFRTVTAALEFARLGSGNLDELFRRLGGRLPELIPGADRPAEDGPRHIEESYDALLADEAGWFAGPRPVRRLASAGDLLSVGRALDRRLGEEPDGWLVRSG